MCTSRRHLLQPRIRATIQTSSHNKNYCAYGALDCKLNNPLKHCTGVLSVQAAKPPFKQALPMQVSNFQAGHLKALVTTHLGLGFCKHEPRRLYRSLGLHTLVTIHARPLMHLMESSHQRCKSTPASPKQSTQSSKKAPDPKHGHTTTLLC